MFKIFSIAIVVITLPIAFHGCSNNTGKNTNNTTSQMKSEGKQELKKNIYDLSVKTMSGEEKKLSEYKGKVLLIVNVASKCGNTPQYTGLENIYRKYKDRGFEILGFPSNDFGGQEPGTNEEIKNFCESKYNVTFPLFDKMEVTGDGISPLYNRLSNNTEPAGEVGWNFEKFLIDKEGNITGRFKSKIQPESEELISAIESKL
ncbi:MAG: glutathione peroxidase [Ignavibacteria bacterium]